MGCEHDMLTYHIFETTRSVGSAMIRLGSVTPWQELKLQKIKFITSMGLAFDNAYRCSKR